MTTEQINYMTQSGMLFLDEKRKKNHFDAANFFKLTAIIPVVLFFIFIIQYGTENLGTMIIVFTVMALVFLLVSYLVFKSQQSKLKLISFDTGISKSENYSMTKKAIEALQWTIMTDTSNFIEAYNPHRDIRTWGNEMVSIVLLEKEILINSICNLDAMNQIMFTFGKNRQNIEKFIDAFELIAHNNQQHCA